MASDAQAATYIVTAHGNGFDQRLAQRIEAAGGRISARLPQIGLAVVESEDAGFAARAARVPGVRSAALDFEVQFDLGEEVQIGEDAFVNPPLATGMDQLFNLQWGHAAIDAAGVWNQGQFGAGATVAVLDSGVLCNHPDLAANLLLAGGFVRARRVGLHNLTAAGAVGGGFWGSLISLIFLNPLLGAAVGAAAGAASGALTDVGINDKFMKDLAATMSPGSSALFVLVRKATPDKVLAELQ